MTTHGDPGWWPAIPGSPKGLIPFYGTKQARSQANNNLIALRSVFLGLVYSTPLFVFTCSFIGSWEIDNEGPAPALVAGVGLSLVAACLWMQRRPFAPASTVAPVSPVQVAGQYRARMFIGIGLAEVPFMVAFAAFFLTTSSVWLVVLGGSFTLACLWIVAPSRRNIARDQENPREHGYSVDLLAALMGREEPPPNPSR